ncbi:MAG: hypothetical protein CVU43_21665 [Chloroflexi bacterium HGW-Chloroflexi-5]|nr:MAG: hypothetical protein CVU43_21665 [Chloroflexi bacterium HGW-Chloroflexi-5]
MHAGFDAASEKLNPARLFFRIVACVHACSVVSCISVNVSFNDFPSIHPRPEPTALLILGLGLMGLAGVRRKIKM